MAKADKRSVDRQETPVFEPPLSLREGARVGVAALSGPTDPGQLQRGLDALAGLGFEIAEAANLRSRQGFLAGSDEDRLSGFHALLRTDVDAILFARGGHGVLRVIDQIDWDLLHRRPRWFVGYSDLTPLLLEISKRTHWMTVHGPMVGPDLGRGLEVRERTALLTALAGDRRQRFTLHRTSVAEDHHAAREISGPLIGGCLAMICACLGTPFDPSSLFSGAIVFLEDIGEAPYKVDRALCQLRMAGLGRARAVVFGHCREDRDDPSAIRGSSVEVGCGVGNGTPTDLLIDASLIAVLEDHSKRLGIPIFHGLEAGHGTPNLAVPIGGRAVIAGEKLTVDGRVLACRVGAASLES